MIDVEFSMVIECPPEQVFPFFQPENASLWMNGVNESRRISEGELAVGSTGVQERFFLGRKNAVEWRIVEFEKNRSITAEVTSGPLEGLRFAEAVEPFVPRDRVAAERAPRSTIVQFAAYGESKGVLRALRFVTGPLLNRLYATQVRSDFQNLKEILESGVGQEALAMREKDLVLAFERLGLDGRPYPSPS